MPLAHVVTFLGLAADAWTAIGTVATAAVATAAALYARGQVSEMRRTREDETRPFVVVDVEPSPVSFRLINLVVENVGRTVARDVRLTFDPQLQTTLEQYPIEDSVLIREGIPTMPPGRRIVALLDVPAELKDSDLPKRYNVSVTLTDPQGRAQTESYILDLRLLSGLSSITEYGVHHVAKSLREIEKIYRKGTDTHGRLKVWVRDEDRRNEDEQVEHVLTGQWPRAGTVTPPDWIMAIGRNPFVRGVIETVPPLQRWLHKRL